MLLDYRLGITNQLELNRAEERIGKTRAKQLFDSGMINELEIGTYQGLADIHLTCLAKSIPSPANFGR